MRASVSNIAWTNSEDERMGHCLLDSGIEGLEIAPTRIIEDNPYDHADEAIRWRDKLGEAYGLSISSMQSIWYGRSENLFQSQDDYVALIEYTKKAIRFAAALSCPNLVFGCPRGRRIPDNLNSDLARKIAFDFFNTIGDYAQEQGVVIAIEANPSIYGTNFLNTTVETLQFVQELKNPGCLLNLDTGALIEDFNLNDNIDAIPKEMPVLLGEAASYINHVHISEPGLGPIKHRALYSSLIQELKALGYSKFVSLEMGGGISASQREDAIRYVAGLVSAANCSYVS